MDNALSGVVTIIYLTDENSVFEKKGDFITVRTTLPNEDGNIEEKDRGVITLRRMFPFDELLTNISVLDENEDEIGIIKDVSKLKCADILSDELEKTYFMPKISVIYSMKERFGYSHWRVLTDKGKLDFSINDIYKSLIKPGDGRVIINDIDGNRYEIADVKKLDKRSYKLIELYL